MMKLISYDDEIINKQLQYIQFFGIVHKLELKKSYSMRKNRYESTNIISIDLEN